MFFYMAEYCDTLQSKEKRNREYKACLNERAILRLLDHFLLDSWSTASLQSVDGESKPCF